jgi:hypothetical protein
MSFRHILFWVFCTVQKLHKTGIPIPISIFWKLPKIKLHGRWTDSVHFLEAPKNRTDRTTDRHRPTDDGQTPSIFWKLPKIGRNGRWTDSVHFLEAPKNRTERTTDRHRPFFGSSQKLDGTDDGQTPSIFWKLPKIGRNGRQTDTVPFLEDLKNWTARTMDRLHPFFGSSQK